MATSAINLFTETHPEKVNFIREELQKSLHYITIYYYFDTVAQKPCYWESAKRSWTPGEISDLNSNSLFYRPVKASKNKVSKTMSNDEKVAYFSSLMEKTRSFSIIYDLYKYRYAEIYLFDANGNEIKVGLNEKEALVTIAISNEIVGCINLGEVQVCSLGHYTMSLSFRSLSEYFDSPLNNLSFNNFVLTSLLNLLSKSASHISLLFKELIQLETKNRESIIDSQKREEVKFILNQKM